MRVSALAEQLAVLERRGPVDLEVCSATHDSRQVVPGSVFAAIPGTQVDGHRFIGAAIERGATLVLLSRWPDQWPEGIAGFQVQDPRRSLAMTAAALEGHPDAAMQVVGVTGTNGKTTTTVILASIFEAAGMRWGTLGTTGISWQTDGGPVHHVASHTTPEGPDLFAWLERMRGDGVEAVALELSSHALEQGRAAGLQLDVGAFSNLSRDHLDYHGSLEAYQAAKSLLFSETLATWGKPGACRVLNIDDPRVAGYQDAGPGERCLRVTARSEALSCGEADLGPETPVEASIDGLVGRIGWGHETLDLKTPMIGAHNLNNLLLAGGCALALGLPQEAVEQGWSACSGAPGRLEPLRREDGRGPLVLVDYAHTPEAIAQVLSVLRPLVRGQLGLLFGCGGDRDRGKRPLMAEAAARGADWVVLTSDNPRSEDPEAILAAAMPGFLGHRPPVLCEVDRGKAIAEAVTRARAEDVLVLAGKGHETYQEIAGQRLPFDDRVEARRALEQWS